MKRFGWLANQRWSLFPKLFTLLVTVMILPVLAISSLNYRVASKNLQAEVNQSNLDVLRQTKTAVDSILLSTENIAYQLLGNDSVRRWMEETFSIYEYEDVEFIREVIHLTQTYMEGSAHIANIYLYNMESRMLISATEGVYRKIKVEEIADAETLARQNAGNRWIGPGETGILRSDQDSVRYIKLINGYDRRLAGFVIIQLTNDNLYQLINQIYIRDTGYLFLAGAHDEPIIFQHDESVQVLKRLNPLPWFRQEQGYGQLREETGDLLVSFTTSSINGWKYIAVVPAGEIDNKSAVVFENIAMIGLFFIMLSLVFSFTMARELYNPILSIKNLLSGNGVNERKLSKHMLRKDEIGQISNEISDMLRRLSSESHLRHQAVQQYKLLQEQMERRRSELKNYLLFRLASGESFETQELREQTELFGIRPDDHLYLVLLVQLDGQHGPAERAAEQSQALREIELRTFQEKLEAAGNPSAFFEQPDRIFALLEVRQDQVPAAERLARICEDYRTVMMNGHGVFCTVSSGATFREFGEIGASYEEAEEAMKICFILGANRVILNREREAAQADSADAYAFIRRMKQHLEAGKLGEAGGIVREVVASLKGKQELSGGEIYWFRHFISTSAYSLYEIHLSPEPGILEEIHRKIARFDHEFLHMEAAASWLHQLLALAAERAEQSAKRYSKPIKQALAYIRNEYHRDISLTELSDRLGVTESHLSRLFKEELGTNFKQYLTDKKLSKAKELLLTTEWTLERISREVGYNQPSQFSRMFKKNVLLSPMEFRQKNS